MNASLRIQDIQSVYRPLAGSTRDQMGIFTDPRLGLATCERRVHCLGFKNAKTLLHTFASSVSYMINSDLRSFSSVLGFPSNFIHEGNSGNSQKRGDNT